MCKIACLLYQFFAADARQVVIEQYEIVMSVARNLRQRNRAIGVSFHLPSFRFQRVSYGIGNYFVIFDV